MSAIKVRSRLCALVVAVVATAAPVTAPFMIHVLSWITHGSLLTILRFPAVIAQEIAPALSLSSQLRLVAIGGVASALPPCRGARLLVCHLLWSAVSLPLLCSGQGIVALQTSTPEVEVPYLGNVPLGS